MAGQRRKKHHEEEHAEHPDERWLVTYADLMTLLVALFMVLFSISSVNKSKFETLQASLQDAFSGRILPGGRSIKQAGGTDNVANPSPQAPETNLQPFVGGKPADGKKTGGSADVNEQKEFEKLAKSVEKLAQAKGLTGKIKVTVAQDGLHIRVLTDDLLFDSGSATPRPQARPLLHQLAALLSEQPDHQLIIQGNTDSQPLSHGRYVDNLELSTERANSIYRSFAADGINAKRMTASGRGPEAPIASNDTAAGRSVNRRVEILVPRSVTIDSAAADVAAKVASIKPDLSSTK